MKIERILLYSFFLILSATTLISTSMVFLSLREALEKEINASLERDAKLLMEEIDMIIFERLQNVHSWAQLDVMQEGRIGDVDKQLSQFLADVKDSYMGMFSDLLYVDSNQNVIAASTAELIGLNYANPLSEYKVAIPNREILIEGSQSSPTAKARANLLMRVPVHDRYSAQDIGYLYGEFDMQHIYRLVEKDSSSESGERYVIILDGDRRMIAGSLALKKPQYLLKTVFADWVPKGYQPVFTRNGKPLNASRVVVGYASSEGYLGYAPLGWSVLVVQNTAQAYFSIDILWFVSMAIISIALVLAFWASHVIARRIAKPLLELTAWVQANMSFKVQPQPFLGATGAAEIRDLGMAFNRMLGELESSKALCIRASKLAVVGEMSAIMAHEVRTPLGILSSAAECLQSGHALSPEGVEMTQMILDESARLNKLVTNILECASPKAPNMARLNMHEILANVVFLLKNQIDAKGHQIQWELLPYDPFINGDREMLTQVFLNLVLNAIQIMPGEGIIRIISTVVGECLSIEVGDNGPGIHQDDIDRLFDPFFTKREDGIGLGLTVTNQIILAHHGSISVKRNGLNGASFTILLPIGRLAKHVDGLARFSC